MTPCYKSFENAHLTCENSTKANLKNSKRTICLCEEHFQNSENLFFSLNGMLRFHDEVLHRTIQVKNFYF